MWYIDPYSAFEKLEIWVGKKFELKVESTAIDALGVF